MPILQQNPRGVLLARDELVGWIGSFDKYSSKGSASADVAHWLSIYNAENVIVDRKTGDRTTMFVPHAAVSVCGSIQPGILNRVLASEHRENGLAARLLMTYPPRQPKTWRDEDIPGRIEDRWSTLLGELFALQHDTGADGKPKSALVKLSDDAQALYRDFVNEHGTEQFGMTGDLAAAWSKLEEIPARIALLLHCVRQASGEPVDPWQCDAQSMQAALELAQWFKNETQRIYRLLTVSPAERRLQQVAEWIERRGGIVRPRDLVTGRRDVSSADEADWLIQELVTAGFGERRYVQSGERGGRPTVEFRLFELVPM